MSQRPTAVVRSAPVRALALVVVVVALLSACGGAPPPRASVAARSEREAAAFVPRIVRQDRATPWTRSDVEVAGVGRREVRAIGDAIELVDPATGIVWATERIDRLLELEIDPGFALLCATMGEVRAARVGALDLATRRWLWTRELPIGAVPMRAIATRDRCAVQVREDGGDRLLAFDLATGAERALDAPPFDPPSPSGRHVLWSRDLSRRHDRLLADATTGGHGWMIDLRDGTTLARRQTFWADCVDASGAIDRIGLHDVESADRRAYLARVLEAEWIECAPPEPAASRDAGPVLLDPWIALADGRLVHHGDGGLVLVDWRAHGAPVRLSEAAVLRYRDPNGQQRPIDPVIGDGWVGAIDAQGSLARWSDAGAPIAPLALPAGPSDPDDAQWQVFAGPGDRLLALRDVDGRRALFVSSATGLARVRGARVFTGIWQHAAWTGEDWLLSDPHFGIHHVDPERAAPSASFAPPESYSRISHAARSPDGARLGVVVGPWGTDDAEGVYVLDARTLAVLAHHPGDRSLYETHDVIDWDARGIVIATGVAGTIAGPVWVAIDPASGARRTLGVGAPRSTWGYRRTGDVHVWRTLEGDALVGVGAIDAETAIVSLREGALSVETPDGHVWCDGAACERYRCIVDRDTAAPIDDPACAALRGE